MRKGKIHHLIEMNNKKLELHHDRHTVSLLTDHMVLTPKYRGKILTGEVAFITHNNTQSKKETQ